MKSVLVPINRDEGQEARFQAALDIVRTFEGHLSCLQVSPLDAFASLDPYGVSYLLSETVTRIRELSAEEQRNFEDRLRNEGLSWDWRMETGDAARQIGDHSWLADLVVVSSPGEDWSRDIAAAVAVRSRAPVLVVPAGSRGFDCGGPAAIAWNGSAESCVAIRAAMPLLARAQSVHLLTVEGEDEFDFPPTEASAYLSRHGIANELVELPRGAAPVSDTLLGAAEARGAACLVMGAYGRSRLRENILGGVTRGMLQKSHIPLLLAH